MNDIGTQKPSNEDKNRAEKIARFMAQLPEPAQTKLYYMLVGATMLGEKTAHQKAAS